jgi:hypothetical protein
MNAVKRNLRIEILLCAVLFSTTLFCPPALGKQAHNSSEGKLGGLPWDRFSLDLGVFITRLAADIRFDAGTLGLGISVRLEDALDLDQNSADFRVDATYRLGRRHKIHFGYFRVLRNASQTFQVLWIPVEAEGGLDGQFWKFGYSFSFFLNEHFDVMVSIGTYVADGALNLRAQGIEIVSEDFTYPFPGGGLRAAYAFTPKLFLKQGIELFYVPLRDYSGVVVDANVALEYNLLRHLGIGIGYALFHGRIKADDDLISGIDLSGDYTITFQGLRIYGKLYF